MDLKLILFGMIFNTMIGIGMFAFFGFLSQRIDIAIFAGIAFFVVGWAGLLSSKAEYKENYEEKDNPEVTIGQIKNGAWGQYDFPSRITINWPLQDELLEISYCKTIIGIDHEYLHHILYLLEGKAASSGFDNLAGNLTDHCRWVGLNLTIEGDMREFWNNIKETIK